VVHTGPGLREPVQLVDRDRPGRIDVEVAGEDARRLTGERSRPFGSPHDLRIRNPRVSRVRRVQVRDNEPAVKPDGDALPPLFAPGDLRDDR
jgi:hypothetical protein